MILDALLDAVLDTLKTLPFLFAAFLAIESLEHYSNHYMNRLLGKVGKAGPVVGALFGCVPQCGFSVAAANLYSGGIITLGTLLAVFLSTSDEAVLILMSHPGSGRVIAGLLAGKVLIGILAGYLIDFVFRKKKEEKHIEDMCRNCGCSNASGVVHPAFLHTVRLAGYLLLFTFVLNLILEAVGAEHLAYILGKDTLFQPFLTALLGLIPNCAASVVTAQLYAEGAISFGSAVAGLSAGTGLGLLVLFRSDADKAHCFRVALMLFAISVLTGMVLQFTVG